MIYLIPSAGLAAISIVILWDATSDFGAYSVAFQPVMEPLVPEVRALRAKVFFKALGKAGFAWALAFAAGALFLKAFT